jgi:WD40 repeat protein
MLDSGEMGKGAIAVPTMRLLAGAEGPKHEGEISAVAFGPDSMFVLSGGWDGCLRLWETTTGAHVTELPVSSKPLSTCAISPDGKQWLSGTLEGMLARWDALTHQQISTFLAHTRPISSIVFSMDGRTLATSSWDRTVIVWNAAREREGRTLHGHNDIVAGCLFTPDGRTLLSWSHDGMLLTWDLNRARPLATLAGHQDRILSGGVSPDSRWAASGSRDCMVKIWDLVTAKEVVSVTQFEEIRGCLFLLDGKHLLTVDAPGVLRLYTIPDLQPQAELPTNLQVQCAAIAPSGGVLALGCNDGRVHMVAIDGFDSLPLVVTANQVSRRSQTTLQKLIGKSNVKQVYICNCPVCRQSFELTGGVPTQEVACPSCRRQLLISAVIPVGKEA